jgi:hypothetical protein
MICEDLHSLSILSFIRRIRLKAHCKWSKSVSGIKQFPDTLGMTPLPRKGGKETDANPQMATDKFKCICYKFQTPPCDPLGEFA